MKKVLIFGTFDILHPGHLNLFKQAKRFGDHLTVIVARDKTVKQVKGRLPRIREKERLKQVKDSSDVDKAMLGNQGNKYNIIKKISPDVICLGYDQTSFTDDLKQRLEKMKIKAKIVRLKPYKEHRYKSSKLKY